VKKNECDGCRGCPACIRMQNMHGTCEYVAKTERCTCDRLLNMEQLGRRTKNVQTFLKTDSTDRVRLAYWRRWMNDEGIKAGLMVEPTKPAPNLLKTDGEPSNDD
jgi:hypothetical protein